MGVEEVTPLSRVVADPDRRGLLDLDERATGSREGGDDSPESLSGEGSVGRRIHDVAPGLRSLDRSGAVAAPRQPVAGDRVGPGQRLLDRAIRGCSGKSPLEQARVQ